MAQPDEIKRQIIEALRVPLIAAGPDRAAQIKKSDPWSRVVFDRLGELGKTLGYFVYGGRCACADVKREWVFDHAWIDCEPCLGVPEALGWVRGVPLVVESEWALSGDPLWDFNKLLAARADHRLLVFGGGEKKQKMTRSNAIELLSEAVRRLRSAVRGDRLLVLAYQYGGAQAGHFAEGRLFVEGEEPLCL